MLVRLSDDTEIHIALRRCLRCGHEWYPRIDGRPSALISAEFIVPISQCAVTPDPGCKKVFDDSLDWLCAQDASALNATERAVWDVVQRIAATA